MKGVRSIQLLSPGRRSEELEQLVKASAISASGEFLSDSSRDLHQYEITIEDGASKSSVIFDDESIPQSAKRLIGYLKKCSKPEGSGVKPPLLNTTGNE